MNYKITATQTKENPSYEEELKEYRKQSVYSRHFDTPIPLRFIEVKTLEVELTQEQFEAMKKSIIETF